MKNYIKRREWLSAEERKKTPNLVRLIQNINKNRLHFQGSLIKTRSTTAVEPWYLKVKDQILV